MSQQLRSAIIGYWRSGATVEQIVGITGLYYLEIVRVIESIKLN